MKITPMYEVDPIIEVGGKATLLAECEWGTEEPAPKCGDIFIKWNREWKIIAMNPHTEPVRIKAQEINKDITTEKTK